MREIRTYGLKRGLPHWTIQGGMPYSTATRKGFLSLTEGNYEPHAQNALATSRGIMSPIERMVLVNMGNVAKLGMGAYCA